MFTCQKTLQIFLDTGKQTPKCTWKGKIPRIQSKKQNLQKNKTRGFVSHKIYFETEAIYTVWCLYEDKYFNGRELQIPETDHMYIVT